MDTVIPEDAISQDANAIPQDAADEILQFLDYNDEMKSKLDELWFLYQKINDPLENIKYKPIDKYASMNDPLAQAEGEFTLFIVQISMVENKMSEIEKEIAKSKKTLNCK